MVRSLKSMPNALRAACAVLLVFLIERSCSKPWLDEQEDGSPFHNSEKDFRPFYIECLTSLECDKESCCAIGRQRFALPHCLRRGGLGDSCYPEALTVVRNHTYPDGATVRLRSVYDLLCPCSYGLYCDPVSHMCAMDNYFQHMNYVDARQELFTDD